MSAFDYSRETIIRTRAHFAAVKLLRTMQFRPFRTLNLTYLLERSIAKWCRNNMYPQKLRVTEHKADVRTGNGTRRFYQNRHWAFVCV